MRTSEALDLNIFSSPVPNASSPLGCEGLHREASLVQADSERRPMVKQGDITS